MALRDTTLVAEDRPWLDTLGPRLFKAGLAIGLFGLIVAFLLGLALRDGLRHFLHSYLTSYVYFLSLSLGALFFVTLQHLTRSSCSVVVRRIAEVVASNLTLMALLLVPILIGMARLYEWARPENADHLLVHRQAYLNIPFFVLRCTAYFAVWIWLARYYSGRSLKQDDSGDVNLTLRMERISAPGLILYALTVTFAAFDLLMSLDARWYSTIYGVYFFSGGVVGFLALLTLIVLMLQQTGRLTRTITVEHYHDLGKFLFAFVFFWAYIAFSQYLLIWYANLPEETGWYHVRQSGPWGWVAVTLVFGHFILPFLGLLSRRVKRRKRTLAFWAGWLLITHWIDIYWLVMPETSPDRIRFHFVDVACLIGIGGLYFAGLARATGARSLVPLKDPRLLESLTFENA